MTIDEWGQNTDQFFDYLAHSEIYSLPEWDGWKERINQVLSEMAYEDAIGCKFEDLISLAGLEGEIELARKKSDTARRLENLEQDF